MRRKSATTLKKRRRSTAIRSRNRTLRPTGSVRRNPNPQPSQRARYYRGIQLLLRRRGYYPTIAQLKATPFHRLIAYIRDNYSREVVRQYLPLSLVYPKTAAAPSPEQTKTGQRKSRTVSKRVKKKPIVTQKPVQLEPLAIPEIEHEPLQVVRDINEPAPLREEILANSPQTQMVNSIFTFTDSHPFDPGLWTAVVEKVPQGYAIPDPHFTSRLELAQEEVKQAYMAGIYEPLTPDSEV